jgi:WD40 repeat protein
MIGKLSGHTSMLTSISMIGKSPVLISGDDGGTLRLWDIRTFSCI